MSIFKTLCAALAGLVLYSAEAWAQGSQVALRPGGSAEVLYSFPSDPSEISVNRNGENSFALKIPSIPAYLTPDISAVYSSRGTDSVMGVGWSLAVPRIALDLSRGRAPLDQPADAATVTVGDATFLRDRWVSNKLGAIVCEEGNGVRSDLTRFACHSDPHSAYRFTPSGGERAQSWIAQDPYEGVTQHYGESDATRIETDDGRTVAWLISREVSLHGKELRYFYEELEGSEQRILRAILMAGDRVIRFRYDKRATNVISSLVTGVERRQEWLLTDIELLAGCTPVQVIDAPDDVWTDLSDCRNVPVVERVALSYRAPETRYTGRYALTAWQHMSGDKAVAYGAARFDYNGDGLLTRGTGTAEIARAETPDFAPPDGYAMINNLGSGPFQTLADWNRDGLADWISTKDDPDAFWPDATTTEHAIHVRARNALGAFGSPRSYREPLARYAVWVSNPRGGPLQFYREPLDRPGSPRVDVAPRDFADEIEDGWPEAMIGIDTAPWARVTEAGKDEGTEPALFGALSMTVGCARLGQALCDTLWETYQTQWRDPKFRSTYDSIGVKLTDLSDFNGDGYLDRAVSGLLVVWDPSAPDADGNGFRDPLTAEPAIYVSYFDPEAEDFRPFTRYDIAVPSGAFAGLHPAFLSALAVNISINSETGSAEMSANASPRALIAGAGIALQGVGLVESFRPQHASASAPSSGSLTADPTYARASGVAEAGLTAASLIANASSASPDTLAAMSYLDTSLSVATGVVSAVDGVKTATAAGDSFSAASGWAQATTSIVGVVGTTVNLFWRDSTRRRMQSGGFNNAVIASNTATGTLIISLIAASVSIALTATLIAIAATTGASGNPVGWALSIIFAVAAIITGLHDLLTVDHSYRTSFGEVKQEVKGQRGIVYKSNLVQPSQSSLLEERRRRSDLLDWFDIDGDRRLDLVIASHSADEDGFAVALGDKSEVVAGRFPEPETAPFRTWTGVVGEVLRDNLTETRYELGDVHRGDLTRGTHSVFDFNADGLPDLVRVVEPFTDENGDYQSGYEVHLNDGRKFVEARYFRIGSPTLPSGAVVAPALSVNRGLFWTEFDGRRRGFGLSLNNTIQTLGPDLDDNGLPDLVVKDETSYAGFAAGAPCMRAGSDISQQPLPADPEPEIGSGLSCTFSQDVWYAALDGSIQPQPIPGEGGAHLTPAAYEVHSPTVAGRHYVAFNTGEGFTEFVEIEQALPSFNGGLSIVSSVTNAWNVPSFARMGVTNALIDPDAEGVLRLVAMDTDDGEIQDLRGDHPVAYQVRIGIPNPDALTRIIYPDGGEVTFDYSIKRDVGGEQGAPLWVLARAEFDDKIRGALSDLQGWSNTRPYVEYQYGGGSWRGGEYLGFEAVVETRFSGDALSQVIQTYHREGPERSAVACTEIRGRALDNFSSLAPDAPAETMICTADEPSAESIGVAEPLDTTRRSYVAASCFGNAISLVGTNLMPLLQRIEIDYSTAGTVRPLAQDGLADLDRREIRRVSLASRIETQTFNGAVEPVVETVEVEHAPMPYLTPTVSRSTTSDGLARSMDSVWRYHDDAWLFFKTKEIRRYPDGSVALETTYQRDESRPFTLQSMVAEGGRARRVVEYRDYNQAGQAQTIEAAGVVKAFIYADDFENGTGLLKTATTTLGENEGRLRVERYGYDVMGRVRRSSNPFGGRNRHLFDALGAPVRDVLAGRGPKRYRHDEIGEIDTGRDMAALLAGQRTTVIEDLDGQQILNVTWWDGFGRPYRSGVSIEGHPVYDLDFDADGTRDLEYPFRYDGTWFADRGADYLLTDRFLTADGEAQCQSQPYLDGRDPGAFQTVLRDAMGRMAFSRDPSGFGTLTLYGTDGAVAQTVELRDGLLQSERMRLDGFGRIARLERGSRWDATYRYDAWDRLTRTIDGRGFATIWERDAWGQPLKECRQVEAGGAPTRDLCPEGWLAKKLTYDEHGRLLQQVDEVGATIDFEPGYCGPTRMVTPSVSATDPEARGVVRYRYGPGCNLAEISHANGARTVQKYDAVGRLVERIQAEGTPDERADRYAYDARGRLFSEEGPDGNRVYVFSDFRNRLVENWRDPDSVLRADFDVIGALSRTVTATGRRTVYESDLMGRMTRSAREVEICEPTALANGAFATTDAVAVSRYEYDRRGRNTATIAPDGARTSIEYDALDRVKAIYAPNLTTPAVSDPATRIEYAYDRTGRMSSMRSASGITRESERDGRGLPVVTRTVSTSGRTLETRTRYDARGLVLSETPPHDGGGGACVLGGRDAAAFRSTIDYAPSGHVLHRTGPADVDGVRLATRYEHGPDGMLNRMISETGFEESYGHDLFGSVTEVSNSFGESMSQTYSPLGAIASHRDAAGRETVYDYDHRGRLSLATDSRGHRTVFNYDVDDRLLAQGTTRDVLGAGWHGRRAVLNRGGDPASASRVSYSGNTPPETADWTDRETVRTCTDIAGRPQAAVDGQGRMMIMRHDAHGRLSEVLKAPVATSPQPSVARYRYDADGRILDVTQPFRPNRPVVTKFEYDDFGRLAEIGSAQTGVTERRAYDGAGRLCEIEEEADSGERRRHDFTYDPRGRIVAVVDHTGARRDLSYGATGVEQTITDPTGTWRYDYDTKGRLVALTQNVDRLGRSFETRFSYSAAGELNEIRLPSIKTGAAEGPRIAFARDPNTPFVSEVRWDGDPVLNIAARDGLGRPTRWTTGGVIEETARYDDAGRMATKQATTRNDVLLDLVFNHDTSGLLRRIDDLVDQTYSRSVTTDRRGRIIRENIQAAGGTRNYRWNDQDTLNRENGAGLGQFQHFYTVDGLLRGIRRNAVDHRIVSDPFGARLEDELSGLKFEYDALDRLTRIEGGRSKTLLSYAHDGRLLAMDDTVYLYAGGRLPAVEIRVDNAGEVVSAHYNLFVGPAIAMRVDALTEERRYFVSDHRANPVVETNADGKILAERAFDSFGGVIERTARAEGAFSTRVGFQGAWRLGDTDLLLMGHRVYDPASVAFLTADPVGASTPSALFSFANANPQAFHDRDGLDPCGDEENCIVAYYHRREDTSAPAQTPSSTTSWYPGAEYLRRMGLVAEGYYRAYDRDLSPKLSFDYVGQVATGVGDAIGKSSVGQIGSGIYTTLDAVTFEAMGNYEVSERLWYEAATQVGSGLLQIPDDAKAVYWSLIYGLVDTGKAVAVFGGTSIAMPVVVAWGDDETIVDFADMQAGSGAVVIPEAFGGAVAKRVVGPVMKLIPDVPVATRGPPKVKASAKRPVATSDVPAGDELLLAGGDEAGILLGGDNVPRSLPFDPKARQAALDANPDLVTKGTELTNTVSREVGEATAFRPQSPDIVLSGHGVALPQFPHFVVPKGIEIRFYTRHGNILRNPAANRIEVGDLVEPVQIFRAGELAPDYLLTHRKRLKTKGNPWMIATRPGPARWGGHLRLSQIASQPGMGTIHWAACMVCP